MNFLHFKGIFFSLLGKVNIPNLPPGVAGLMPPQYMIGNPSLPAAYFNLQSPHQQAAAAAAASMYSTYGPAAAAATTPGTTGLEDLAALQRNAGLHTLVGAAAQQQQQQQQQQSSGGSTSQAGGTQPSVPQPGSGAKASGGGSVVRRSVPFP